MTWTFTGEADNLGKLSSPQAAAQGVWAGGAGASSTATVLLLAALCALALKVRLAERRAGR